MANAVLALNAGSSSLKFALFNGELQARLRGSITGIGGQAQFQASVAAGDRPVQEPWEGRTHEDFLKQLLAWIAARSEGHDIAAVGHRIVHGGQCYTAPVRLDETVLAALKKLNPLAPLHQPHNLSPVQALLALRPGLPQVGCFDTAFHATMPPTARRFGLPRNLEESGVKRYGFHGLSYDYIVARLRQIAPQRAGCRIIVAHLGSGASLCALRDGQSIDTTMGMTALDGLVMSTRVGALDPGALMYLAGQGMTPEALESLLYLRSGLLGVSGFSGDMRTLLASDRPEAAEAVELFVYRAVREIGALAASLGGLDGLVFTAGIGENSAIIRRRICDGCAWLGVAIEEPANQAQALSISAAGSRVGVWVIPTDEEHTIARQTLGLLKGFRE